MLLNKLLYNTFRLFSYILFIQRFSIISTYKICRFFFLQCHLYFNLHFCSTVHFDGIFTHYVQSDCLYWLESNVLISNGPNIFTLTKYLYAHHDHRGTRLSHYVQVHMVKTAFLLDHSAHITIVLIYCTCIQLLMTIK